MSKISEDIRLDPRRRTIMGRFNTILLLGIVANLVVVANTHAEKVLLWGDTHLHSSYSFDAFLNGNLSADPDVAYRYAKGLPVIHPYNRTRVRINTPLDFLVIADHAEFYGGIRDIYLDGVQDPDPNLLEKLAYWYRTNEIRDAIDSETGPAFFANLLPTQGDPREAAALWTETIAQVAPGADFSATNAWQRMREIAERHYQPGHFSTIIGWEWSSIPAGANLHRVVMTDADGETAGQFLPYSSTDSPYPDDLWRWLEKTSQDTGANFIAIPHNPNISKGIMFADTTLRGHAIDLTYAQNRIKWEPVAEVTQIKGDSETHPDLSPNDPFADFETYPWYIQQERTEKYIAGRGDFMRSGLLNGLRIEQIVGHNPFQFGVIGSTDSHSGLASAEEPNFWGKMAFDSVPERKQDSMLAIGPTGWSMQAGGLAAVWATENSREAILAAFKRKEVYATTGPRIRLRFTAQLGELSFAMGASINNTTATAPEFSILAQRDPKSASLDRIQIIKGWVDDNNKTHETIFNVAWAGDRSLDNAGQLTAIADTVNRQTGTWDDSIGANELQAIWSDPSFDANTSAFYYVRVLQIPTPR
ncbi:MAG: DUF3604 domain-containing protein, partial [Gammaproteobacteria bacterium]|nr:DUF3604 domain-containing protein [Gammaproteobacteria bacterium]